MNRYLINNNNDNDISIISELPLSTLSMLLLFGSISFAYLLFVGHNVIKHLQNGSDGNNSSGNNNNGINSSSSSYKFTAIPAHDPEQHQHDNINNNDKEKDTEMTSNNVGGIESTSTSTSPSHRKDNNTPRNNNNNSNSSSSNHGDDDESKGKMYVLDFTKDSLISLGSQLTSIGLILLYAWMCEHMPLYNHGMKDHNQDFFWFIFIGLLVVSLGTIKWVDKDEGILNRDQTEEWKGWMQVMFLLYHYFDSSEVYNTIRVLISCYVWMTGFGNFSFFYMKSDYGFVRFIQMMWRLNFLVFLLCMTMNNMYVLYYICPLHTFYFLLTFATMFIYSRMNHSKYGARIKLVVLALVIYIVWEFPPVFEFVWGFLPSKMHPGAAVGAYGVLYEWHFRSGLDHWSTYFGMIFALNFPQNALWLKQVERLSAKAQFLIKIPSSIVMLIATYWWAIYIWSLPKLEYNRYHPYLFFIPMLTYIFIRNLYPSFRKVHLGLLNQIGKVTLETYLMQHHIWLTSNAKTLLVLIPGWPMLNLLVTSFLYVYVSRKLYRLTLGLRAILIPEDTKDAIAWMTIIFGIFSGFYILASILKLIGANGFLIGLIICVFGVGLLIGCREIIRYPFSHSSSQRIRYFLVVLSTVSLIITSIIVYANNESENALTLTTRPLLDIAQLEGKVVNGLNCLNYGNDGVWMKSPAGICKKDTMCEYRSWKWTGPKSCKYHAFTQIDATKVLDTNKDYPQRIIFHGDEQMQQILNSIIKSFKGSTYKSFDEKMLLSPTTALTKIASAGMKTSLWTHSLNGIDGLLDDVKNLDDKDIVVFNINLASIKNENVIDQIVSKLVKMIEDNPKTMFIWIQSPQYTNDDEKEKLRKKINSKLTSSKVFERKGDDVNIAVVDLNKIVVGRENDKISQNVYHPSVYDVAKNIIISNIDIISQIRSRATAPPTQPPKKKDSSGLAHSPKLGLFVIAVAIIMLFTMDNYVAIPTLFKYFINQDERVTWEESVKKLHAAMGIQSD